MSRCLIGLGSNLGNRVALLDAAIAELERTPQVRVVARSRFHETPPAGGPAGQGAFLNGAALIETPLTPEELLSRIDRIEVDLGRRRVERWGPRPIDLDLLLYDDAIVATQHLQLPHPRMAWRRFVLAPAAEVAPDMLHPTIGWTVAQLLDHVETARSYVAIAGPAGAGKTQLAEAVANRFAGVLIADPAPSCCGPALESKSSGIAPRTELEFAKRRAEAVAVDSPIWNARPSLWISDFWVGQSAAAIRAVSEGPERETLLQRWQDATRQACPPKLAVLLDAPAEWCARRLVGRGMAAPNPAELRRNDTIRQSLMEQMRQAGCGPVLVLNGQRPAEALEELAAAILAMS